MDSSDEAVKLLVVSGTAEKRRQVGTGAFGTVWRLSDAGRRLAVKRLTNDDVEWSVAAIQRVYSELKAMTSLKHDNILSADGFLLFPRIENFTDVYVFSQLMETDLNRIIASGQPLASTYIQLFIYQILRGLKYLHSTKIVHGDIKPGNMLVNSNCHLKIGDFGLASSESDADVDSPTLSCDFRGTLPYAAPEQLLGVRSITSAVDMWSAGCVLGEMLTRRVLFHPTTNTSQQLDLTIELVGGHCGMEDFRDASEPGRRYLRHKLTSTSSRAHLLYDVILQNADHAAKHLLSRLLVFSPRQRLSASQGLSHVYARSGQRTYHTTICDCCVRSKQLPVRKPTTTQSQVHHRAASSTGTNDGVEATGGGARVQSVRDDGDDTLEPVCRQPFRLDDTLSLDNTEELKEKIRELYLLTRTQAASELCLNVDCDSDVSVS